MRKKKTPTLHSHLDVIIHKKKPLIKKKKHISWLKCNKCHVYFTYPISNPNDLCIDCFINWYTEIYSAWGDIRKFYHLFDKEKIRLFRKFLQLDNQIKKVYLQLISSFTKEG